MPIGIITGIEQSEDDKQSQPYLDQALFTKQEGDFAPTNNPIINFSKCNPAFIENFGQGIANDTLPYVDVLRDKVAERISAVFHANATPRMLASDVAGDVDFIFKNAADSESHLVTPRLFFGNLSKKKLLAFEVHDIMHYSLQLATWPDELTTISGMIHDAYSDEGSRDTRRLKQLGQVVWRATFEDSILSKNEQLFSFGCLNWLAPNATPASNMTNLQAAPDDVQRVAYQWHYLSALLYMYRMQNQSSQEFNTDTDWLEKLGYTVDEEFQKLCRSEDPAPLEKLDFWDAPEFTIRTPQTPKALFDSAIKLLRESSDR